MIRHKTTKTQKKQEPKIDTKSQTFTNRKSRDTKKSKTKDRLKDSKSFSISLIHGFRFRPFRAFFLLLDHDGLHPSLIYPALSGLINDSHELRRSAMFVDEYGDLD